MADQSGRVAIVTGANSGIGFHAARELAAHGAKVVLAVRDARGQGRRGRRPDATATWRCAGSTSPTSRRCARSPRRWDGPLDVLVNNAGVMATPQRETADGFELQLGTNHLGHFALTGLLLERLPRTRAWSPSRAARTAWAASNFDDLQSERGYQRWRAYGQSKLANLLFTFELQRRADDAGFPLTQRRRAPRLRRDEPPDLRPEDGGLGGPRRRSRASATCCSPRATSAARCPTLFAATEDLPGGAYVGPDGIAEMRGHPHLVTPRPHATDQDAARRLWEVSDGAHGRPVRIRLRTRDQDRFAVLRFMCKQLVPWMDTPPGSATC